MHSESPRALEEEAKFACDSGIESKITENFYPAVERLEKMSPDQTHGILSIFEANYLRRTFDELFEKTEGQNKKSIIAFSKPFTIKDPHLQREMKG